jgi:hypothetical protein
MGPTPPGTGVISHQASIGQAIDGDIDNGGAGLDPFASHQFRLADRRDQDVGTAALSR